MTAERINERAFDRLSRCVRHVGDAIEGVSPLPHDGDVVVRCTVERDLYPIHEHPSDEGRSFMDENIDGARIAAAGSGAKNIVPQKVRRISNTLIDDPALGVQRVRFLRKRRAGHKHHTDPGVREIERADASRDAGANDKDI